MQWADLYYTQVFILCEFRLKMFIHTAETGSLGEFIPGMISTKLPMQKHARKDVMLRKIVKAVRCVGATKKPQKTKKIHLQWQTGHSSRPSMSSDRNTIGVMGDRRAWL